MIKINASSVRGYLFSLSLAFLVYLFYTLVVNNDEMYFVIPIELRYPDKFIATSPSSTTVNITVRGSPASLVRVAKEDLISYVDLSKIDSPGVITREIEITRTGTLAQLNDIEINFEPSSIEINLEEKLTKQVRIEPSFENSSPRGYLFKGSRTIPTRVEISGPSSVLGDLSSIKTESIDLSLYKQSTVRNVKLEVPNYVSFVTKDADIIRVEIEIEEVKIVETYKGLLIEVKNLNDNLIATDFNVRGEIVVQGPQLAVENFRPILFVDLASVKSETRLNAEVQVVLSSNIELVSINPETVELIIQRNNTTEQIENKPPSNPPFPLLVPSEENLQDTEPSTIEDNFRNIPKVPLAPANNDSTE